MLHDITIILCSIETMIIFEITIFWSNSSLQLFKYFSVLITVIISSFLVLHLTEYRQRSHFFILFILFYSIKIINQNT